MPDDREPSCKVLRAGETYRGAQGFDYFAGISAESTGARGLCMHLTVIPPGTRGKAHMHEHHESAIYVLEGEGQLWHGDRLEHHVVIREGDMVYIGAGVPHLAANLSDRPLSAVIARTDPNEQESVRLLPELEGAVPA